MYSPTRLVNVHSVATIGKALCTCVQQQQMMSTVRITYATALLARQGQIERE